MGLSAVFICYPPPGMGYVANDRLCSGGYIDVLVNVNVLNDYLLPTAAAHVR